VKSHISAAIDSELLEQLNRYGKEERRSRSQVIELALDEFLRKRSDVDGGIVTSQSGFEGSFSREETYERGWADGEGVF
jgi:metal-responsive CopG/Arc/MetJ family transcriptional regulator